MAGRAGSPLRAGQVLVLTIDTGFRRFRVQRFEKEKVSVNDNVHFLNPTTSGYAIIID